MDASIRLYVPAALAADACIEVSEAQAHYLGTVMRRRPGDAVRVFNGRDGEFAARITSIRRGRASLGIDRQVRPQTPEPDVWLVFALLKRDATDLVLQKATELGVAELHPVITEHTNTHRANMQRLLSIAVEAAEQCERLTVPRLHEPRVLADLLAAWPSDRRLFAAVERISAQSIPPVSGPRALLVGPEGGFTTAELDALRAHPFVTPVTLGPHILRAETACIAGLALLQGMDGR